MIYFTGDTHGEQGRFSPEAMPGEYTLGSDDTLIITGDFGYIYLDTAQERIFLKYLQSKPYIIVFVDGNHENFPAIYSYPTVEFKGGTAHKLADNVYHLMRGEIYRIEDKSIFVMGGAYSIDRYMRTKGFSYWEEELPSNEEYLNASRNLNSAGMKVDIIVTHTAPRNLVYSMGFSPDPHESELQGFLEWVKSECEYSHWFFGHFHLDKDLDEKHHAVFYRVLTAGGSTVES